MELLLSARLMGVCDYVIGGRTFADVGTDHAYLPAYLILNGIVPCAVASDVRKGPLESAGRTAEEYGVSDKMELVLSDGLDKVREVGEAAIAGMGGIMIADIVTRTPWLKSPEKHLVLQPMTQLSHLRKRLYEDGFYIEKEKIVEDGTKLYIVMSVFYDGVSRQTDELFQTVGDIRRTEGNRRRYLKTLIKKYGRIADGQKNSEDEEVASGAERFIRLKERLSELLREIEDEG